ncbi:flagellar biosynthetic protein FliO [Cohnella cholangitidis]|uniref:Flagellar protein n=1 Tax=Cohnella cholangitidis TaxID=2598458 RepID=A0A7G5BT75_9BACL|nr:flagellar biosynthetic protein FliO [Cohnella cholangitidis]QMV40159.1 flagellar protein [Cohnella cholangitidis]
MRSYGLVEEIPLSGSTASAWDLIWVLFVLGIIIGLIVLVLRFFAKRNRGWGMNRSLRSLGGFPLGTNKSMQIVEWNGRIYVLGVGDEVTLLESITEPEVVAALLAEHDSNMANTGPALPEWLRKWTQRNNPHNDVQSSKETGNQTSFEHTLENRLRQLSERRQRVEQLLEDSRSGDRTDKR